MRNDLPQHPGAGVLAFWHEPRFNSGFHDNNVAYTAFWQDLFAACATLVLNGHAHGYERFVPQDPAGVATSSGMREFVVGTGGKKLTRPDGLLSNSEAFNNSSFGILN